MSATTASVLQRERHIKYWKRCHKSYLPAPYISNDSIRLTLACFIISSLDVLKEPLTTQERLSIRRWVLSLQHPNGGFCGSSTHSHSGNLSHAGTANIAATYFALILLALAAGDSESEQLGAFEGVQRRKTLLWLKKLQFEDGGFGQLLWDGKPVGGNDVRHRYLAAGIRWMLRGDPKKGDAAWVQDIDTAKLEDSIRKLQTYDGGLGESHGAHESHAGYTYCGISALALLKRPAEISQTSNPLVSDSSALLKFLSLRQFRYLSTEEDNEEEYNENLLEKELSELSIDKECLHVGFNGRWNKKADTCYCWWAGGTLSILDHLEFLSSEPARNYLLQITQHVVGGFSKSVGAPPDVYHSYLGLAALAVLGEPALKEFDVELCCSLDTTRKLIKARAGLLTREQTEQEAWNDGFWN